MRLLEASLYSLLIALSATVLALCLALVVGYGASDAQFKGRGALALLIDSFQSVPAFLLILLISQTRGSPILVVILALGFTSWPSMARLMKYIFDKSQASPPFLAAQALGATRWRLFWNYLWPEARVPLLIFCTQMISLHILFEGALSFLGLGIQPPQTSLGVLAYEGWRHFDLSPTEILYPSSVLFILALFLSEAGHRIESYWDPRGRTTSWAEKALQEREPASEGTNV